MAEITGLIILEVPDNAGGTTSKPVCTGLAISPRLVLTARHCFEDDAGATLGYTHVSITLGNAENGHEKTFELKHDPIDQGKDDDDFAVLQSVEQIESPSYSILAGGAPPVAKEGLFILHYPGAGPLVITQLGCHAAEPPTEGIWLRHRCDTEPTSSGAPIFDSVTDKILGIHRRGGKGQDLTSANSGLLLGEIVKQSRYVREALDAATSNASNVDDVGLPAISVEFELPGGTSIVQRGKAWAYHGLSGINGASSPLVLMSQNNDEFLFWNPQRDIYIRVPRQGGDVRSRPAEQATEWTPIGEAIRKK